MTKSKRRLPHIGRVIRDELRARGMTCAEFARRLNVERTTVYGIFENETIDVYRLIKISEILGCDFFSHLNLVYSCDPSESPDSSVILNVNLTEEERTTLMEILSNAGHRR